jgi:carbon-monoxide dehydrogenase large subunit
MNAPETDVGPPVGDVVGASLPRLESVEKVTGAAQYAEDLKRPGMLYGAVLGSAHAHARIRGYDVSAARALPGVKAVLTGADIPANRIGTFLKDQFILARDKVRYLGEPVAAVAAVDVETARAAVRLIEVDYDELPAVFDPELALRSDAPVLHEERASYECLYELPEPANATSMLSYQEGDPDAAFAECDVVIEDECLVPAQNHLYMEPVCSLAEVDGAGKLHVWSSCQGVSRVQMMVAAALGLPMSKVRAIGPRVGGGFGGKGDLTNQGIAAALALATRRPVRVTMTRDEDMTTMRHRHAGRVRIKTGARADGTLVARRAEIILDGGAYSDESPAVGAFAAYFARGPYRIAHTRIDCWVAYTNAARAGAFRGFGNPQVTFAAETQVDAIAARLGRDPIDLRIQNA